MNLTQKQLGERIKVFREKADFSQEFVANYLKIHRPSFLQIEKGERKIDSFELKKLADLFRIDMADFFVENIKTVNERQAKPVAMVRLRGAISETGKAAVSDLEKVLDDYRMLLDINKEGADYFHYVHEDLPLYPVKEGNYKSLDAQATRLASNCRRAIGIETAPIQDIFKLLDDQNIFVVRKSYDDPNFSGCFVYKPDQKLAAILINSNNQELRQRFTAAHEYGHFLCHRGKAAHAVFRDSGAFIVVDGIGEFTKKEISEQFADLFAKSFLVPREELEMFLEKCDEGGGPIEMEKAVRAQIYFGVSRPCILNCLQNYGLITGAKRKELESDEGKWKDMLRRLGYQNTKTNLALPPRYREMAFKAFYKGEVGISKLAELLGVSVPEVQDQLTVAN